MTMKKAILLSAMALFALASCEKPEVNPNYNPETGEVATKFVVSVSTGAPETRMTAESVQKANNFLGIDSAMIFVYQNDNVSPVYVTQTDGTGFMKSFEFPSLITANDAWNTETNNQTTSSHRILSVSIPTGSNAALFYAKAVKSTHDAAANSARGYTANHFSTKPSETYFSAMRRIGSETDVANYDATGRLMIYVINYILDTSVPAMTSTDPADEWGYKELPALSLKELGHVYKLNHNIPIHSSHTYQARVLTALEDILGEAYYIFTNTSNEKYRAGSSNAMKSVVTQMYTMLLKAAGSTPTSAAEANALRLGKQIKLNIEKFFDISSSGTTVSSLAYKGVQDVQSAINAIDATLWNDADKGFVGAQNLNLYPYGDFGIPEGAAQLEYNDSTDHLSYLHPNNPLVNPTAASFEPRKYVYPAELLYYGNSGFRVTDNEAGESSYPNGTTPWITGKNTGSDINLWASWTNNGRVTSTTKGVAIRDNIHYGVALLKTRVAWGSDTGAGLEDNRAHFSSTEGNRTIALNDANIQLHGILVGGINPHYDWQMLPVTLPNLDTDKFGSFDGVIYDDQITEGGAAVPTAEYKETYTLVYDNYNSSANTQNTVYVTLEFINNGDAFWGKENLIPKGGTFYLVGKLTPDNHKAGSSIAWPDPSDTDYYPVPPIYLSGDNVGKSQKIPRVFVQNFLTDVTFRIGKTSLQNAFYSLPDIASASMTLGLSVDLQWRSGYEYDIEFNGGL